MKNIFLLILFLFGANSCNQPPDGTLEQLIAKRDSLQDELILVKQQIEAADTAYIAEPALVTIDTVRQATFEHFIELQGVVEADQNVVISAEIPALIKKIHVKEGQKVKKGTLLVTLDDEGLRNKINELKTKYELANYVFIKRQNLKNQNIGSEFEFEKAKNDKESIEQALKTARSQLSKTKIKSYYSGVVDDIFQKVGELAGPQMPLIRFISFQKLNIKVDVPESYLERIDTGDSVEVLFSDIDKIFLTEIIQRGSFIEPMNRTFKILIDLPSGETNILPNLIGVVKIRDFKMENALLLNVEDILQDSKGNDYVFTIELEGDTPIARKTLVESGDSYNGKSYIKKGLKKNDLIVSEGARSIVDGQPVNWEKLKD